MEGCREGTLLFLVSTLLLSASGVPTLSVDVSPSNYGTTETLKCIDASYISGNSYAWEKDGVTIFTQAGELTTTGKYSESIDRTTFKLVINDIDVSDEGAYTCSHAFANSNTLNLQVESQGTATAKLSSSNLVEVTFNQIYPSTISAVITCDSNIVAGSFVSSVAVGDRVTSTWQSTNTFTTKPTSCSASVTLRTTFSAGITFTTVTLPPDGNQTNTTTTPPTTSTTTPSASIPTSTTSTNSDSSSTSTTTSSAVVPNPATSPSSGNETTVIIISSVVGGLFFVGIVITIVLMLLSQRKKHQSVKHSRKHRHHDQDRRRKRLYNQGYPTLQEHGQYNNTSYMEYPGIGTKMNPLYVPNRSAYRAEQTYNLGHPSADHQSYIRNHHLYYNSNIRPQTSMHSYQQRYYGGRGGNNMISSTLHRDENNYVAPDYELYW